VYDCFHVVLPLFGEVNHANVPVFMQLLKHRAICGREPATAVLLPVVDPQGLPLACQPVQESGTLPEKTQEASMDRELEIFVGGKRVPTNQFARQIIISTVAGLLTPLRDVDTTEKIQITVGPVKQ